MKLNTFLIACLMPLALGSGIVNSTTVSVKINQQHYAFTENPRLADVLAPEALNQQWYWPASKLFMLSEQPNLVRQRAVQQLKTLAATADDKALPAFLALQNELASWQLGQRVPIRIDYDVARADIALNPRFEAGQYLLLLTERPATVRFFGALQQSVTLDHRSATAVRDYIADLPVLAVADKQQVIVIQPNGTVITAGIQLWNKQHIELMPGAMVYVPFNEGWFTADFSELNKQIPLLAVDRMY